MVRMLASIIWLHVGRWLTKHEQTGSGTRAMRALTRYCSLNMTKPDPLSSKRKSAAPGSPPLVGLPAHLFSIICVGVSFSLRLALDPLWGDRLPYATFFLGNL